MSLIAVDFDHTLTEDSGDPYQPGGETPNEEMIEYVQSLKEERNEEIIIWTARPWSHAQHIAGLLTIWGVPYNGIRCEKGGADAYLDDKAVNHVINPEWQDGVESLTERPHGIH
jgi:trehalose-6-phosphatase